MTFEEIEKNETIRAYISKADESLVALGYTEHSFAHVTHVAAMAGYLLETLGYDAHTVELAKIAGYLHDIGNLVNRIEHSQSGAVMAFQILTSLGFGAEDVAPIVTAIGNHDESTGGAKDPVSAALVLADKTDVRRNRVREKEREKFDIHDRVNFAVTGSSLKVDPEEAKISLNLQVDESICTMYEYFDIFLGRMMMCRGAAEMLGANFRLTVNGGKVL